jgi:hypothetical protein
MTIHSAKITGTGAVVLLSSAIPQTAGYVPGASLAAKWIQVTTDPTNAARVNVGGPEVTAPTVSPATNGVGYPLFQGISQQLFPPVAEVTDHYAQEAVSVGIAAGDILYILWGI